MKNGLDLWSLPFPDRGVELALNAAIESARAGEAGKVKTITRFKY